MNIQTDSELSLDQFLSDRITHFLSGSMHTLNSLSMSTSIHRSTLSKLIDKESSLEKIDAIKLMKLIKILSGADFELVTDKYKEQLISISKAFEAIFEFKPSLNESNSAEQHASHLSSRNSFLVYLLASNHKGTTELELSEILGNHYKRSLEQLIELGLLEKSGELIQNTTEDVFFSRDFVQKNIRFLNDFYTSNHAGQNRNYIFFASQSLNRAGLKKSYEIMAETHKKLLSVMRDPAYKGSIPFFSTGVVDTLVDKINDEKGVLQ